MPIVNTADIQQGSLKNHFLLAMPSLNEGIFAQSVTYICDHGPAGAMGLIINRPLDINLQEIFDHLAIKDTLDFSHLPVMAGGPVELDHGFVLHSTCQQKWQASLRVTPSLMLTTSRDILAAIAQGKGPAEYLIALGYAGWEAGQLEQEIAENSWLTLPADNDIIFSTPTQDRLAVAAARLGIDITLISSEAGHA